MPAILSAILSLIKGVVLNPKIISIIGVPAALALLKRLLFGGSNNMGDKLKEVKDVLVLIVDGIQKAQEALADGHLGLEDIPKAVTLFPDLVEAVKGCTSIPSELAAMQESDAKDLVAFIETKFPVSGKGAEITDAALKAAFSVWKLIQAIQAPAAPAAVPAPAIPSA